jgi:hypothetical protein
MVGVESRRINTQPATTRPSVRVQAPPYASTEAGEPVAPWQLKRRATLRPPCVSTGQIMRIFVLVGVVAGGVNSSRLTVKTTKLNAPTVATVAQQ